MFDLILIEQQKKFLLPEKLQKFQGRDFSENYSNWLGVNLVTWKHSGTTSKVLSVKQQDRRVFHACTETAEMISAVRCL